MCTWFCLSQGRLKPDLVNLQTALVLATHCALCKGEPWPTIAEHEDHREEGNGAREGKDSIEVKCVLTKHFGWFCAAEETFLCGTKHKISFCLFQFIDQKALEIE